MEATAATVGLRIGGFRVPRQTVAGILDLRPAPEFCAGHAAGAINVAYSEKSLSERVAAIVPEDAPLVLVTSDERQAEAASAQLSSDGRVSLGRVAADVDEWRAAGSQWETLTQIESASLADDPSSRSRSVLDVREPIEWETGHVPGAILIPLGALRERLPEVPLDREIAVICEAGIRSATAASLLRSAGVRDVVNVSDGTAAYRNAGGPLEFPSKDRE